MIDRTTRGNGEWIGEATIGFLDKKQPQTFLHLTSVRQDGGLRIVAIGISSSTAEEASIDLINAHPASQITRQFRQSGTYGMSGSISRQNIARYHIEHSYGISRIRSTAANPRTFESLEREKMFQIVACD